MWLEVEVWVPFSAVVCVDFIDAAVFCSPTPTLQKLWMKLDYFSKWQQKWLQIALEEPADTKIVSFHVAKREEHEAESYPKTLHIAGKAGLN